MAEVRKFAVLAEFQPYQRILEVFDGDNFRDKTKRNLFSNIRNAMIVSTVLMSTLATVILGFWCCIEAEFDFDVVSASMPIILTYFQFLSAPIALTVNVRAIRSTIEKLCDAVDKRMQMSDKSAEYYRRIEARHSMITILLYRVISLAAVAFYIISTMLPISYACFNFPSPDKWILPLKIHSIYERGPYVEFFINWLIEVGASLQGCFAIISSLSLYASLYAYTKGMVDDLKAQTGTIRDMLALSNEIQFHCEITAIFSNIQHIVSELVFFQLLLCAAATAIDVVALESSGIFSVRAIVPIYDLIIMLTMTFVYCYLSESMASCLNEIAVIFYDMAWYRLPIKAQKLLIPAIQHSQQEYRLNGIGFVDCSLYIFGKIIRSAGSFFLFVRKFK